MTFGLHKLRPWGEAEVVLLVQLRQQGKTWREIGDLLKRPLTSCENKYNYVSDYAPGDRSWPPTKDPWPVKVNFASENLSIKSGKTYVTRTDHGEVRSLVGTTLG